MSNEEMSIPINPPYGLNFNVSSKLGSGFQNEQVAKKTKLFRYVVKILFLNLYTS